MSESTKGPEARGNARKSTPGRLGATAAILVVAVGGSLAISRLFGWSGFLAWLVWIVLVVGALAADVWVGRKYWDEPKRY